MSSTTRTIHATPSQVWDVLADGWRDTWPATGSKLHHSVGAWPLLIDDNTEVTQSEPGHVLALRGRGWPAGEVETS